MDSRKNELREEPCYLNKDVVERCEKFLNRKLSNIELLSFRYSTERGENRINVQDDANVQINVTCRRYGHVPPIAPGTQIVFDNFTTHAVAYTHPNGSGNKVINISYKTCGIIVECGWFLDQIHNIDVINNHINNTALELWYKIIIPQGTYWVRYDWIKPIK